MHNWTIRATSPQILVHKSGVKIVRKTFLTYSFEKIQKLNVAGLNKFGFRKCHLVTLCVKVATTFLGFWALCIMVVVLWLCFVYHFLFGTACNWASSLFAVNNKPEPSTTRRHSNFAGVHTLLRILLSSNSAVLINIITGVSPPHFDFVVYYVLCQC
jgi:hypothetical protein